MGKYLIIAIVLISCMTVNSSIIPYNSDQLNTLIKSAIGTIRESLQGKETKAQDTWTSSIESLDSSITNGANKVSESLRDDVTAANSQLDKLKNDIQTISDKDVDKCTTPPKSRLEKIPKSVSETYAGCTDGILTEAANILGDNTQKIIDIINRPDDYETKRQNCNDVSCLAKLYTDVLKAKDKDPKDADKLIIDGNKKITDSNQKIATCQVKNILDGKKNIIDEIAEAVNCSKNEFP